MMAGMLPKVTCRFRIVVLLISAVVLLWPGPTSLAGNRAGDSAAPPDDIGAPESKPIASTESESELVESEAEADDSEEPKIRTLIADLNSDVFDVRQQATQELAQLGAKSVPALLAAIEGSNLEVKSRILLVLESGLTAIPLTDNKPTPAIVLVTAGAIESLAKKQRDPVGQRALRILSRHSEIREELTLRQLQDLGAIVGRLPEPPIAIVQPGMMKETKAKRRGTPFVTLGKQWNGGVAGIDLLTRIFHPGLSVYIINYGQQGSSLDENELAALQRILPESRIQKRGEAHLGVMNDGLVTTACRIGRVAADTAAARAGLEAGDFVLEFNGEAVGSFGELVDLIGECSAGQKVDVVIRRDNEMLTKEVTLGNWSLK